MAKITFPHPPSNNTTVAGVHVEARRHAPVSLPWGWIGTPAVWGQKITFYVSKFILVSRSTMFWENHNCPKQGDAPQVTSIF